MCGSRAFRVLELVESRDHSVSQGRVSLPSTNAMDLGWLLRAEIVLHLHTAGRRSCSSMLDCCMSPDVNVYDNDVIISHPPEYQATHEFLLSKSDSHFTSTKIAGFSFGTGKEVCDCHKKERKRPDRKNSELHDDVCEDSQERVTRMQRVLTTFGMSGYARSRKWLVAV